VSWAYAYAFRAGDGHERCDDICVCETLGDTIIAAVSDGAGSAERAHAGAAIACQSFVEMAVPLFAGTMDPNCLLAEIRDRLPEGQAEEHSCTLVAAIAGPKGALFLQVGDGAAVFRGPGEGKAAGLAGLTAAGSAQSKREFEVALWPEETEFLNHTFFVTAPDAESHLLIRRLDEPIFEFALFSDGLQHMVVSLQERTPHQPFFDRIFLPLSSEPEHDLKASWWLERQLGSDGVTKRTDDDTSIVIARRLLRC
jgi:hypothetical protein